jgi:hypothetical protein
MNKRTFAVAVACAAIAIALVAHLRHRSAPHPVALETVTPSPTASAVPSPSPIPASWKTYPARYYGFTFSYPPSWLIEDTELSPYATVHNAFVAYANNLTAYASAAVESGTTNTPLVTMTFASKADAATLSGEFNDSLAWLKNGSTGIPGQATVSQTTIDGKPATVLDGLTVVRGTYELIAFYDTARQMTCLFDLTYSTPEELATLRAIVRSFSFTN